MFSPLRNRFGIPGVISVIALVFAMMGGAYAATNNGGKATSSAKAKKGPRGPRGLAGPAGPAGAKGDTGAAGANGSNGSNGKDGVSVTSVAATEAECPEGGTTFTSAGGTSTVCNGEEGPEGPEGNPWADGGTLPPGATETGVWTATGDLASMPRQAAGTTYYPIAFSIPLAAAPTFVVVKEGDNKSAEGCDGIVGGLPTADPGKLCLYMQNGFAKNAFSLEVIDPTSFSLPPAAGASRVGAILKVTCDEGPGPTPCIPASGTWAVTGQ